MSDSPHSQVGRLQRLGPNTLVPSCFVGKKLRQGKGLGYSSVAEHLPSRDKALGSISSTAGVRGGRGDRGVGGKKLRALSETTEI